MSTSHFIANKVKTVPAVSILVIPTAPQFHHGKRRSGMARMYGPDGQYMLNNVSEMVAPNVSHIYIHKSCLVC